jgi:hypothetical protein
MGMGFVAASLATTAERMLSQGRERLGGAPDGSALRREWQQMKVYLDDERPTPEGWRRVYWPDEAIELLRSGEVSEISLDHDLGDDARGDGYDVLLWIEQAVVNEGFRPPIMRVHSANAAARPRMEQAIESIHRLARRFSVEPDAGSEPG